MPLVVTPGASDANSYATLLEAEAHLAGWPYPNTAWDAGDADKKEGLLKLAAIMLDREVRWRGDRYRSDQALEWPRSGFTVGIHTSFDGSDRFDVGRTIGINEIPIELKLAQALCAALDLARSDRTQDVVTEAQSVQSTAAGGATTTFGRVIPKRISDRVFFVLRPEWHNGTRVRQGVLGSLDLIG